MDTAAESFPASADVVESRAGRTNPPAAGRAIFNPALDFLCLGGASLLVLPVALLVPASGVPVVTFVMVLLADIVNNPHFAVSYQIFYRGIVGKVFGDELSPVLRARYVFAGVLAPLFLIGFFAYAFANADGRLLAMGGNVMMLLVGWHYNKQGYGMLIVDSVFQRRFFTNKEKLILRFNAHACWLLMWLLGNRMISERNLWDLKFYSFAVPQWALFGALALAMATSVLTLGIFARRVLREEGKLPVNGVVAYIATLYVWLMANFHPVTIVIVPFFHSLQYLLIVSRFEINRDRGLTVGAVGKGRALNVRMLFFAVSAVLLGLAGFWWLPKLIEGLVDYDREAIGGTAFLFMFWIFINVHHYFIDNVIWRRDNPEAGKYLFA